MEQNSQSQMGPKYTKWILIVCGVFIIVFSIIVILQTKQSDLEPSMILTPSPSQLSITKTPLPTQEEVTVTYNYKVENPTATISFDYPSTANIDSSGRIESVTIDHIINLKTKERVLIDINGDNSDKIDSELDFKLTSYTIVDIKGSGTRIKLNPNPNYKTKFLESGKNKHGSFYKKFSVDNDYLVYIFEFPSNGSGSWYIYLSVDTMSPSEQFELIFDSVREK